MNVVNNNINYLRENFNVDKKENEIVIALFGNPNTGKSTVFNSLTGLNQHTGNWPGKTVSSAKGRFSYKNKNYIIVDLPGTYSLFSLSQEEFVARDFICFGKPDILLVVCDANSLERNLNVLFQAMEITKNIILCVNLIDEAKKNGIKIDKEVLENELGIPVVLTSARNDFGIDNLLNTFDIVSSNKYAFNNKTIYYDDKIEKKINYIKDNINIEDINNRWLALRILDDDESLFKSFSTYSKKKYTLSIEKIKSKVDKSDLNYNLRDYFTEKNYEYANYLNQKATIKEKTIYDKDDKVDKIVTSNIFGIPIMISLLVFILWITIFGANYPSSILSDILFGFEPILLDICNTLNLPIFLTNMIVFGIYKTLAWVVSVMLPPMAIFFPFFTLLEDFGYLPRIAFNLDHLFKKVNAHGKQSLTMCMGLGCNACGVVGCRIIDSPRERLIAILTNNFVPCNGRFPILISISTIFFASNITNSFLSNLVVSISISVIIIFGILITLFVSFILSKTLLKGYSSTFTLELPPYRTPKFGRVLYTSIIDRTIFVLSRAVLISIPAGCIIWILANTHIDNTNLLTIIANFLNPIASIIGLDGFILLAFILGFPANEIVVPIILMCYLSTNTMVDVDSIASLGQILKNNNWTILTALNTMIFSLLHWPCATTILTIKKETNSIKWPILAFLIPTTIGFIVCSFTTLVYKLIGA